MQASLLQRWLTLDELYKLNHHYSLNKPNQVRYTMRPGSLFLTAPHAVHHYRSKAMPDKSSDARSGGLCELLGEQLNASSLTVVSFVGEWHSWEERTDDFKRITEAAVAKKAFIIDLHGMSDEHNIDICLGLGPTPSKKVQKVAQRLSAALSPFSVAINTPFGARSSYTVTSIGWW